MRKSRRAIMLVSVLLFSMLTLMFATAAISLAPASLARSAADSGLTASDRATRSGLDWVRSRISQDPRWNAAVAQTFTAPGLYVREGEGQVVGWVAEGSSWSRFRIRFNYQDGAASSAPDSDGMNDPSTAWTDFPYCSCNNLTGSNSRPLPVAQSLTSSSSSSPWTGAPQLTVPSTAMVVSIEGASGRNVSLNAGTPQNFIGAYHKRVAQVVLKLGNNQPITDAAVMAAGNLLLTSSSVVQLNATGGAPARMRTKSNLTVNAGVTSPLGELMHAGSQTISGTLSGVTVKSEDATGLYRIPASKVRVPSSPIGLQAGTYLVDATGHLLYVNMEYKDYVAASPKPPGTAVPTPAGMTIAVTSGNPKVSITLTKDLQISPSGALTGFALVPDGGAPQSATYGGIAATTPPTSPVLTTPDILAQYFNSNYSNKMPLDTATLAAWQAMASANPRLTLANSSASGSRSNSSGYATTSVPYTEYSVSGGGRLLIPNTLPTPPTQAYIWQVGANISNVLNAAAPAEFAGLQTATAASMPAPPATPPAAASAGLKPKDLELKLQGGSSGVMLANDGDITIGAQIASNGSALVSKGDIHLIGTSTDFNSSSGTQLGLNLYAQGSITVDAYDLDATAGGTFHSVKLQGVVYAWKDVTVLAADGSGSSTGPFTLKGSLVAYGGDPAGSSTAGTGNVTITAGSVDITYDPSYVAGLAPAGPFSMKVLSWHQF
ncbi:hypothetical protein JST97_05775 [bacterium]|nr:hypothetical protein [bacterium]